MKHIILLMACVFAFGLFAIPSFAQSNTIVSISVRNTRCDGGSGTAVVEYGVDGGSPRYLTASSNSSISRNVSKSAGSYIEEFFLAGMDLSAPDYAIRVTVRLGSSPSSSSFDLVTAYFDCRTGGLLVPNLDARDNSYTIPRNTPTPIPVALNDRSALPKNAPRPLTQPVHADVVLGADGILVVTADADYIGPDSFIYEICDISRLCDRARVNLNIINQPPTCDAAANNSTWYWSPNHDMVQVQVNGVVDPDGDAFTLVITSISVSDVEGGDGGTTDDYDMANGLIRVERSGQGDGRTYLLAFDATDIWGDSCSGVASVYVPHDGSDIPDETATPVEETSTTTQTQGHGNGNGNGNGNGGGGNGGGRGNTNTGGTGTGNGNGGENGNGNGNGGGNANGNGNGRGGN
jgi:hypothetical protein